MAVDLSGEKQQTLGGDIAICGVVQSVGVLSSLLIVGCLIFPYFVLEKGLALFSNQSSTWILNA